GECNNRRHAKQALQAAAPESASADPVRLRSV
ncbi:MAG: hypothetical protein JWP22_3647, partial [Ramlibacter sp.]|nr:hypothetical protein [Ramlibacter sp.]